MSGDFLRNGYPNLYHYGWKPGVYCAPAGYEHRWLCVTEYGTSGHWTKKEAQEEFRDWKSGESEDAILDRLFAEAEREFWEEVAADVCRKGGK